jgi:phosphoribosylaminoimidazole-succinocarboxamide synthase
VADTKIELGRAADGTLLLADEVLTPTRPGSGLLDRWQPGRRQPSFDKQYVRDWLTSPARAGTGGARFRRRRCPPRWSSGPGRPTSRPTSG